MSAEYTTSARKLHNGEQIDELRADADGALFVKGGYRYATAVTPSGTAIAGGPTDGLLFSADTVATVVMADEPAAATVDLPLAGKVWHPVSVTKVTAVTGGVTVVAGWQRRAV